MHIDAYVHTPARGHTFPYTSYSTLYFNNVHLHVHPHMHAHIHTE